MGVLQEDIFEVLFARLGHAWGMERNDHVLHAPKGEQMYHYLKNEGSLALQKDFLLKLQSKDRHPDRAQGRRSLWIYRVRPTPLGSRLLCTTEPLYS